MRWLAAICLALAATAAAAQQGFEVDLSGEWRFSTGDNPAWARPDFDDSDWDILRAPALWDRFGYADYDGFGWYRRWFTAPPGADKVGCLMIIGGVDDHDWVYINGRLVGHGRGCYKRRVYRIPPGIIKPGRNLVAVRIYDGAMGGGLAVGPLVIRTERIADRIELADCCLSADPSSGRITFRLALKNTTDRPQRVQVQVHLVDYFQRTAAKIHRSLSIEPGAEAALRSELPPAEATEFRAYIALRQGGESQQLVRFPRADALAGPRRVQILSGRWQAAPLDLDTPQPTSDAVSRLQFRDVTVPIERWGGWQGKSHRMLFRRTFRASKPVPGRRLVLRFEAVAHFCRVFVNGRLVGEHLGGFEPFELDITDAVRDGQNELWVDVTDWVAGLKRGTPIPDDPEKLPRHCMLIPYGTRPHTFRGIWQDVYLIERSEAFVSDAFVRTSVRKRSLALDATVHNASSTPRTVIVSCQVFSGDRPVFALPKRTAELAAGGSAKISWQRTWTNPRLWWPHDPHLYWLSITVRDAASGQVLDVHRVRFGFREFWIDGIDYRLNGRIFRLRGLVCAPHPAGRQAFYEWLVEQKQQANTTMVRNHMYPRPRYFYDIADEVGVCLKDESAFYCAARNYALTDERFWQNLRRHISAMVLRSRNHPSVCIWSAENEILHCGGHATPGTDEKIARLGRIISSLDPTRPVEFEGDGDVNGRAATINIHYPREFGCHDHNLWPNDAYWLGKEGNDRWPRDLIWKRDKPIILGEFCYYPYSRPPGGVSIFSGELAYLSRRDEQLAHVMGVKFICQGCRWQGVAGLNPWVRDLIYGQVCLPPIVAIIRQWDCHFWPGERIDRDVLVLNDTLFTRDLRLEVAIYSGARRLAGRAFRRRLDPGGRWLVKASLPAPQKPGFYWLRATVSSRGKALYTEERPIRVFDPDSLAPLSGAAIAVFDPSGRGLPSAARQFLQAHGAKVRQLRQLSAEALRGTDLLIIARDAMARVDDPRPLWQFIEAGGLAIAMPQKALPGWLPGGLSVDSGRAATMAYPCYPGHPLLRGLEQAARDKGPERVDLTCPSRILPIADAPRAFCWWRPDNFVAHALLRKPRHGNFRILVQAGGRGGLRWAALVELPRGRGCLVLCQLDIDEKPDEPSAALLWANAAAAARSRGAQRWNSAAVYDPTGKWLALLRRAGFAGQLIEAEADLAASNADVLIVKPPAQPSPQLANALRAALQAGRTVWLHCPDGQAASLLAELLPGASFRRAHIQGRCLIRRPSPLTAGISNSDLFWFREDCFFEDWEGRGQGLLGNPVAHRVAARGADVLIHPGALVQARIGRGRLIVDTLRLEYAPAGAMEKALRVTAALLTNLGVALGEDALARLRGANFQPLDISKHFTAGLTDETPGDGQGGWTDQGPNDMRSLPRGRQVFGGVPFIIGDGCIALQSPNRRGVPAEVGPIPVGRVCRALVFLHAAAWASKEGVVAAECRVRYADGRTETIQFVTGVNVGDWWQPRPLPMAQVAWTGSNPEHSPIGLWMFAWPNPRPSVPIQNLTLRSTGQAPTYLLLAITLAQ